MSFFRRMKSSFIVTLLALTSTAALADWDVQNVHVKKVEQFQSGSVVTRVIYEVVPGVSYKASFGCSQNDTEIPGMPNHYQASYWASGTNSLHQILVGQLLAAQAQGVYVDLFFDASGCNNSASYGYGGLGRTMRGVSVSAD